MRTLLTVLVSFLALTGDALAQGKLELAEVDAWLVRDAQMSSQFAVAEALGYFKAEGIKVNPRWYIAGTDLPSMWGAGNIHLGTATATMVVPIAASGQTIYNIAPQSDIAGVQQVVLGKKAQEIVKSPKDLEKLKIGMPVGAVDVPRRQGGGWQALLHRQPQLHSREGRPGGLGPGARRRRGERQDGQGESEYAQGRPAGHAQGHRRHQQRPQRRHRD